MNIAQQLIAKGAAVLAKYSPQSEEFTFESETVWANCNRTPASNDPEGVKGVSTEEGSVIEWPLTPVVERGDGLVDSFGFTHRIKSVKHIRHGYRLECEVTR